MCVWTIYSCQEVKNMQPLGITKQCGLLGLLDSIISSKQQYTCSGGWTGWWKQQQVHIYSNATLKWDSPIVGAGPITLHFPSSKPPLTHPIYYPHPSPISLTHLSISPNPSILPLPIHSPTPHPYRIPYPMFITHSL